MDKHAVRRDQGAPPPRTDWPQEGIAVEGDFSGIQNFILKPVPGVRGAAKRLRGRSLLVVAITELIAKRVESVLGGQVFYSAGGRFLVHAPPREDGLAAVKKLQTELDGWMLVKFHGEAVFHLAAAQFSDRLIPRDALEAAMRARKANPLGAALLSNAGWREEAFHDAPGASAFKCPACLGTADVGFDQDDEQGAHICAECDRDKKLGGDLARASRPGLVPKPGRGFDFVDGIQYGIGEGGIRLEVIHHAPKLAEERLTLEEIAKAAAGREWLGYLRIDADKVGNAFDRVRGRPGETRELSQRLHRFFCHHVQDLISRKFPWIYAVYGGGDDLFLVGPWDHTLDFAALLAKDFEAQGKGLTFSAGLALAKPKQHILTKSEEAERALRKAKDDGRNRINALGAAVDWRDFPALLRAAKEVTEWRRAGTLPGAFLHDLLTLERMAGSQNAFLHYKSERNLRGREQVDALRWARSLQKDVGARARAGFIARYAMLAAKKERTEEGETDGV